MQHLPTLQVMQRALRVTICPKCYQRPPGSEQLGPNVPRSCEPQCTIFINLPTLRQIAQNIPSPTLGPYQTAVRELVCQNCASSPTAGDYCADGTTRNCPLSRYMGDVIETLEKIEA